MGMREPLRSVIKLAYGDGCTTTSINTLKITELILTMKILQCENYTLINLFFFLKETGLRGNKFYLRKKIYYKK